jgi:5-oxopent-3-ene-1,2,5-tricarboxylate decarboxylase/2-hydroxyhepta-2,4-diene-1,7-dioate isomerase
MDVTNHDHESTSRAVELTAELRTVLNAISVDTIVHQLEKRGITSSYLTGLRPLRPGQRMLGHARTLRFLPLREDQRHALHAGVNAQRRAVEESRPDDVLVIDARGVPDAGTIGDLLALRLQQRGAAGVVTDGAVRDPEVLAKLGLPCYHQAVHGATFGRRHIPFEVNRPVACAGVLVMPDDIMIGDGGGCAVLPAALAVEVARDARQQEVEESWAAERIGQGESTLGTFPVSPERRHDFSEWAKLQGATPPEVSGR